MTLRLRVVGDEKVKGRENIGGNVTLRYKINQKNKSKKIREKWLEISGQYDR